MEIIRFEHKHTNGTTTEVAGFAELRGRHRENCLCYQCDNFKPGQPDNCEIANSNYQQALKYGIVTPVFECPKFVQISVDK